MMILAMMVPHVFAASLPKSGKDSKADAVVSGTWIANELKNGYLLPERIMWIQWDLGSIFINILQTNLQTTETKVQNEGL